MNGEPCAIRLRHDVRPGLRLDVDLELEAEATILFGASGAGKTTILRMIAGLRVSDLGIVRLGADVILDTARAVRVPLRKRGVGMIFQDDLLFPHRDVAGNIGFGLQRWPRAEAARRVAELADLCGVAHLLGRSPDTLSGGERQRVGLARAIAPRPRLLLCDEPVSALDHDARFGLLDRLRAIQRAERIPVLAVTHGVDEALAFADRLLLLDGGRIVADGPPLDVLSAARTGANPIPWRGAANLFAATVESSIDDGSATVVRLGDGTRLVVAALERPVGTDVTIEVAAAEILLARGTVTGVSARNLLPGRVIRVVDHGAGVEVLVRVGGLVWMASVVRDAVTGLSLAPGCDVTLVVKARGCRALGAAD